MASCFQTVQVKNAIDLIIRLARCSCGHLLAGVLLALSALAHAACPNVNPNSSLRVTVDFNTDCKSEILWRNPTTGENAVFTMNGFALTSSASIGGINPAWNVVGVGDFDGDGKADILWRNPQTGDNAIFLMDGYVVASSAMILGINPAWRVVGVADFDGDGKADILWRNPTTGDNAIFMMNGFTLISSALIGSINPAWNVIGAADFDGDGKADILWRNPTTGDNAIFMMNGFTLTSSALILSINPAWNVVGVGDFNNDGKADILWRNPTAGDNAIFLMDGYTLTASQLIVGINPAWNVVGVGDYNTDGKADILWRNPATGDNAIFLMDGFTLTSSALIAAVSTSWAIVGVTNQPIAALTTLVSVGEKLFNDKSLSVRGQLACASCHFSQNAHADPAGTFLPMGGPLLSDQGLRSSPSLRYLDTVTAFQVLGAGSAKGGFFWDGRVDTRAEQARRPLFSPTEMANADTSSFIAQLRAVPYFGELLGVTSLATGAGDEDLLAGALHALQAYQEGDPELHLFTSKFDAVLDGRTTLTAQEARGLALFNNPASGNCVACHPSSLGPGGAKPLFTNSTYFALGMPRNSSQRNNADPAFFDLGLCGPQRTDLALRNDLCGLFKTPTLRNVALTGPYFHNAAFNTLQEVVSFYATRDTDPARWYPVVDGVVQKFNDLPSIYHTNVTQIPPFGRTAGTPPALSPQDVDDIVAFLNTLTDGWTQ